MGLRIVLRLVSRAAVVGLPGVLPGSGARRAGHWRRPDLGESSIGPARCAVESGSHGRVPVAFSRPGSAVLVATGSGAHDGRSFIGRAAAAAGIPAPSRGIGRRRRETLPHSQELPGEIASFAGLWTDLTPLIQGAVGLLNVAAEEGSVEKRCLYPLLRQARSEALQAQRFP